MSRKAVESRANSEALEQEPEPEALEQEPEPEALEQEPEPEALDQEPEELLVTFISDHDGYARGDTAKFSAFLAKRLVDNLRVAKIYA